MDFVLNLETMISSNQMIRDLISTLGPKVPFQAQSPSTMSCSLEEWEHSSSPMTVTLEQDSGEAHPSDSACRLFLTLAGFELSLSVPTTDSQARFCPTKLYVEAHECGLSSCPVRGTSECLWMSPSVSPPRDPWVSSLTCE